MFQNDIREILASFVIFFNNNSFVKWSKRINDQDNWLHRSSNADSSKDTYNFRLDAIRKTTRWEHTNFWEVPWPCQGRRDIGIYTVVKAMVSFSSHPRIIGLRIYMFIAVWVPILYVPNRTYNVFYISLWNSSLPIRWEWIWKIKNEIRKGKAVPLCYVAVRLKSLRHNKYLVVVFELDHAAMLRRISPHLMIRWTNRISLGFFFSLDVENINMRRNHFPILAGYIFQRVPFYIVNSKWRS